MSKTHKINRKNSPLFTVIFENEDGKETKQSFDPIEVMMKLDRAGLVDEAGKFKSDILAVVEKFREIIGLPSISISDAMDIFSGFQEYVSDLEKKLPWMRKSPPATAEAPQAAATTPSDGSASGSTPAVSGLNASST